MKYKVESSFEYRGLPCLVLFYDRGHRCGYVGVPEGHQLYEMGERKEYSEDYTEVEMLDTNGGTNFFNHHPKFDEVADVKNYWWIGWDYDHSWDETDGEAWKEYFPEDMQYSLDHGFRFRHAYDGYTRRATIPYVAHECQCVVDQIIDGRNEDD